MHYPYPVIDKIDLPSDVKVHQTLLRGIIYSKTIKTEFINGRYLT